MKNAVVASDATRSRFDSGPAHRAIRRAVCVYVFLDPDQIFWMRLHKSTCTPVDNSAAPPRRDVRDGARNRNSVYAAGAELLLQVALAREEGAGAEFNGDEVLLFLLKPVPQREKHRLTSGVRFRSLKRTRGSCCRPSGEPARLRSILKRIEYL
jgi:hypothetical protein